MPALIYPDLSWSGRFHRFILTLRIVTITGTIGAVAGGAGVLAMIWLFPETPQPLYVAARKPVIIHSQAMVEAMPAPAIAAAAATPAAAVPPAAPAPRAALVENAFGAPPAGELHSGSFYDHTNLPDAVLPAKPAAPAKEQAPVRAKRRIARPRQPIDVAARAGQPLSLAPGHGQDVAERNVGQRGYYDQWRGPPAVGWNRGGDWHD